MTSPVLQRSPRHASHWGEQYGGAQFRKCAQRRSGLCEQQGDGGLHQRTVSDDQDLGVAHLSSASCVEVCRRAGELTKHKQVLWFGVNNIFLNPDGTINTKCMWDLLHPSAEAWAKAMAPGLNRLLAEESLLSTQTLLRHDEISNTTTRNGVTP